MRARYGMKTNGSYHGLTFRLLAISLMLVFFAAYGIAQVPLRRINIPNLDNNEPFAPAIFWLGKVNMDSNYADVRVWYYNSGLNFVLHITDRLLWYDSTANPAELTQWDAVSIYLDVTGNSGQAPTATSYWFVNQLWEGRTGSYRGNGTGWVADSIPFTASDTWRGNYPNDSVWDMGWQAEFFIPFSSLGMQGPPEEGTRWGVSVVVHDRDSQTDDNIPDQIWPESMRTLNPVSWGQLQFGRPIYTAPTETVEGDTLVRQGLDGISVPDAAVGGHTICGGEMNAWTEWGNANYEGYTQFNIQNQWDISDFMCFSKYYVTFPLDRIPPQKSIVSATVTLNLFGNAGYNPGDAKPSTIDVLTISEDWVENKITWNNAPYASENISVSWVYPVDEAHPAGPYSWDVSSAVAEAYQQGKPLRLVFYSTDGDYHSGKYFWSSDTGEWNAEARPSLEIQWGPSASGKPEPPTHLRIVE